MSFDWKATLGTVAPALATAFGGPLAGIAAKMAGDALGLGANASQVDIANALATGDPDVLVKMKQAETQFKATMRELDVQLEEIHGRDRASTRLMAVATTIVPQIGLSILFVVGYFFVFYIFFNLMEADSEVNDAYMSVVMILIGVLTAALTQILNFWFGSSSGSKEKTHILGEAKR